MNFFDTIGGMFGLSGGAAGTGFAGPSAANVIPTTNAGQLTGAQAGSQNTLTQQQALLSALQGQGGLGNQSQIYNQLQGVISGTGPNPAQTMLNQATGQNVANQAALMAGQRGAAANPALIARQAAQQGAATQQQAAGQAATLQAQQALGALGQAGGLATQMAGQQIGQTNQNVAAQQAQQQMLLNAAAQQNAQNVAMQSNINAQNAALAGNVMGAQQGAIGGLFNALGASGALGQGIGKAAQAGTLMGGAEGGVAGQDFGQKSHFDHFMDIINRAQGGEVGSTLKQGGAVPGEAKVKGNSYDNDTVDAKLSPGELVVDRETMKDHGKAGDAARFLAAVIAAKNKGKK